MPIYKTDKRRDGKQQYRVRINYTDKDGKHRQIERTAYGYDEARDLERQLQIKYCLSMQALGQLTFAEFFEEYIKYKRHENRETSIEKSCQIIRNHVIPYFGGTTIADITPRLIADWKNELNKTELGVAMKQRCYSQFRAVFAFAVRIDAIHENPMNKIENFKDAYFIMPEQKLQYYTPEEFTHFAKTARSLCDNDFQWSVYAAVLLKSCSNGASEMVSQLSTAVTTFLFNATMMRLLGEDGVAAITVIIYSQFLLTTLYIGFSMGVAPIISYNYGSENIKQLKKVVRICFCFILAISVFVFMFSFFTGESIAKIFAENNENVFEITKNGFSIFSFSFLFSGCNIFASALFTALSNGKVSATISFLRTFGFILIFLLVLPRFLEVRGVWLAIPIAELLTLMLTLYLIFRHRRHYNYL